MVVKQSHTLYEPAEYHHKKYRHSGIQTEPEIFQKQDLILPFNLTNHFYQNFVGDAAPGIPIYCTKLRQQKGCRWRHPLQIIMQINSVTYKLKNILFALYAAADKHYHHENNACDKEHRCYPLIGILVLGGFHLRP